MAKPSDLPEWDTTQVNAIEPTTERKEQGWLAPGGIPEKPPFQTFNYWQNEVYRWLKAINDQGILEYDNLTDYVSNLSYVVGSDGILYACKINNGPSSSVVNPVGDLTGTWINPTRRAYDFISSSTTVNVPSGAKQAVFYIRGAGGAGVNGGGITGTTGGTTTVTATNVSITVNGGDLGRTVPISTTGHGGGTVSGSAVVGSIINVGGGNPGANEHNNSYATRPGNGGYAEAVVDLSGITSFTVVVGAGGINASGTAAHSGSSATISIKWSF